MRISRRTRFFAVTAVVALVMSIPAPSEYRWVAWGAAMLATFWVVLMLIEDASRGPHELPQAQEEPTEADAPFGPPPFLGRG